MHNSGEMLIIYVDPFYQMLQMEQPLRIAELLWALRSAGAVISFQEFLSLTWPLDLGINRRPSPVFRQMDPSATSWPAIDLS
jgi:hypothetical protein